MISRQSKQIFVINICVKNRQPQADSKNRWKQKFIDLTHTLQDGVINLFQKKLHKKLLNGASEILQANNATSIHS